MAKKFTSRYEKRAAEERVAQERAARMRSASRKASEIRSRSDYADNRRFGFFHKCVFCLIAGLIAGYLFGCFLC